MKSSRAYRSRSVKQLRPEEVTKGRGGSGVHVGLDVGKEQIYATLRWGSRDFSRPWKAAIQRLNSRSGRSCEIPRQLPLAPRREHAGSNRETNSARVVGWGPAAPAVWGVSWCCAILRHPME